jgi:ORF6N domain
MEANVIQPEQIEQAIQLIRGQRVMLDRDLAALYGVETKNPNKAVRRKIEGHDTNIRTRFGQVGGTDTVQFAALELRPAPEELLIGANER